MKPACNAKCSGLWWSVLWATPRVLASMCRTSVGPRHASNAEIADARMFTRGFGRILVGQGVCTVVSSGLQPCPAMAGKDGETLDSPLS